MKDEFNPTRQDLHTLDETILSIKAKKNVLVQTKISLQNRLSEWGNKYKDVKFEGPEFAEIKAERHQTKTHLNNVELQIKGLNEELIFKNKLRNEIEFHLKNNKRLEGREDLERLTIGLTDLKKKYSDFAKDRTRIASLRVMASEISGEIEKLLKKK